MNYKTLTLQEIQKLYPLHKTLDTLSDDDAFDLMQRYNELMGAPKLTDMYSNLEIDNGFLITEIEEDNQTDNQTDYNTDITI